MDHIRANNNLVFGISASCCDRPAGRVSERPDENDVVTSVSGSSLASERALLSCKTSSAPTFTVFLSDVIIPGGRGGGDFCHVDNVVEAAFAPKGQSRVPRTSGSVLRCGRRTEE